jgi:hypothetical protein
MTLPGFTAEDAISKRPFSYISNFRPLHVSAVVPAKLCLPYSESSGCPSGYWCSEPGFYPHCHCLECTPTKFGIGTTVNGKTTILLPGPS